MTTPEWVSGMLQRMAAESTGTAAPIHLQGEPMALAPAPSPDAVPRHGITLSTSALGASGLVDCSASCECGWRGTTHRTSLGGLSADRMARADGLAHAAQFKAPEAGTLNVGSIVGTVTVDPHLQAYAAKRAEWLQAVHDADVADKALGVQRAKAIEARRAMRLAEAVADKAAQHRDEQRATAENLDGELWALVKGEQA